MTTRFILLLSASLFFMHRTAAASDTLTTRQTAIFLDALHNSRIIGIGEENHLKGNIYRMKASLVQTLIREGQCRLLLFEASMHHCLLLDRYVKGDAGIDIKAVLPGMNATNNYTLRNLLNTPEMLALFNRIRDYNSTHAQKVSIAGFDFQAPVQLGATIDSGLHHLSASQPALADSITGLRQQLHTAIACYNILYEGYMDYRNIIKVFTVDSLKKKVAAARADVLQIKAFAARHMNGDQWLQLNLEALTTMSGFYTDPNGAGARDTTMFNIARYFMQLHPGEKTILWAANAHLQEGNIPMPGGKESHWMGYYIRQQYGTQYTNTGVYTMPGCLPANTPAPQLILKTVYPECFKGLNEELIIGLDPVTATDAITL